MRLDLQRLKGYAPLGFITTGILCWRWTAPYAAVLPWIIAAMLFFAVLNLSPRATLPRPKHLLLYLLQMLLGGSLFALLSLWNREIALSLGMCFLAPAATAAGAMTNLMHGDTGFATGYTLLSHGLLCLVAPLLLPLFQTGEGLPFWTLSGQIALLVARMVLLPIALVWLVRYLMHLGGRTPRPQRQLTYWLWLSSLIFILGRAVAFVVEEGQVGGWMLVASFAVGLVACAVQFTVGRWMAGRLGVDEVACRQALGQKNTALTLWLCMAFLPPLVAPGIAGYIAWQNFFLTYYMNRTRHAEGNPERKP